MIYYITYVHTVKQHGKYVEEERNVLAADDNLPAMIAKIQKKGFIRMTIQAHTKEAWYGQ